MLNLTAAEFTVRLTALQLNGKPLRSDTAVRDVDNSFAGIRMGDIFELGKEFSMMPVAEIEKLMESPIQKVRVGALSIMGQCAKGRKCTPERLAELYELYIRRHDRINDWGLVDLAAYYVVGQYLADKPRDILYKLARSADQWERRTAIVATAHFILKLKQVDDTFAIAEILVRDPEKFVQTGAGWMLRTAGDVDRPSLLKFLNENAAVMPRVMLRYSIEKLDKDQRDRYLNVKKDGRSTADTRPLTALPTFFTTQSDFRKWLAKNHKIESELLVGYYKVGSDKPSMTWPQSVDEALCFGWIDGVRRRIDDDTYSIRFTPRKPTSIWSAINIKKAEELIEKGLMRPAGVAAYRKRKENKSRIYAYENASAKLSPEFEKTFRSNKKAWSFFTTQAPSYQKTIRHWIMRAKQETTRVSRLDQAITASENQKRIL